MKNTAARLLFLFALSFVVLSCSQDDTTDLYSNEASLIDASKVAYSPMEVEIMELINAHRVSLGLSSLETLNIISGVADSHTKYMIDKNELSHDHFALRSKELKDKAKAISVGENVAYGYGSAKGVLSGWLNSDGHRAAIENPAYTHFGISTDTNSEGRYYFTNIFIKK